MPLIHFSSSARARVADPDAFALAARLSGYQVDRLLSGRPVAVSDGAVRRLADTLGVAQSALLVSGVVVANDAPTSPANERVGGTTAADEELVVLVLAEGNVLATAVWGSASSLRPWLEAARTLREVGAATPELLLAKVAESGVRRPAALAKKLIARSVGVRATPSSSSATPR